MSPPESAPTVEPRARLDSALASAFDAMTESYAAGTRVALNA
jgi:hypothetical protein